MGKGQPGDATGAYREGVGAVIVGPTGGVLVARRTDTPEAWQLPQGGLDAGEIAADAVRREVREELGIDGLEMVAQSAGWLAYDLPVELRGRVWSGRYRGQRQRWFVLRYRGADRDIRPQAVAKPEFDAWRWVDFESVPDLIVGFKRPLYRDLVAEFGPLVRGLAAAAGALPAAPSAAPPAPPPATYDEFQKLDIRVGTVVRAEPFAQARKPAFKLWIDFGPPIGERTSSAQIVRHYAPAALIGRQVVAVVNFPPKRIAGFVSQCLVLGLPDETGEVVLIAPDRPVPQGGPLF